MTPRHDAVHRDWGESCAFLVVLALELGVQNRYALGGPVVALVLSILLAFACGLSILMTLAGTRRGSRFAMIAVAAVLTAVLFVSFARIISLVVKHPTEIDGAMLLNSALVIWVSNVVLFAVLYHWIGADDFIFPQAEGVARKRLVFFDYLFLSFTTATAFSPTDTPPITTSARMLMMLESIISLATIAIAAARAVNILT